MISTDCTLCVYDNDLQHMAYLAAIYLCASLSSISREVWYADLGKLKPIRLTHLDSWNLDRGGPRIRRAGLQNFVFDVACPKYQIRTHFPCHDPQTSSPHYLARSPHLHRRTETLSSSHPKSSHLYARLRSLPTQKYAWFSCECGKLRQLSSLAANLPTNLSPLCQFKKRCG